MDRLDEQIWEGLLRGFDIVREELPLLDVVYTSKGAGISIELLLPRARGSYERVILFPSEPITKDNELGWWRAHLACACALKLEGAYAIALWRYIVVDERVREGMVETPDDLLLGERVVLEEIILPLLREQLQDEENISLSDDETS